MTKHDTTFGSKDIVWDLSDLFSSLKDPRIDKVMKTALEKATEFESEYKSKVASLSATELNKAYATLEGFLQPLYRLSLAHFHW